MSGVAAAGSGASLDYLELAAADIAASKAFFAAAFGWTVTDYGPDYAAVTAGASEIGLFTPEETAPPPPLGVIRVGDVDAALAAVEAAGGTIVRPIFAFPGGRRFHFREPSGTELAAYQPDQATGGG